MAQHKWAKEIHAWADGAEIEWKYIEDEDDDDWLKADSPNFDSDDLEFRIKPQPKKPQYLYVYLDDNYELSTIPLNNDKWKYIGKIKLEVEDE